MSTKTINENPTIADTIVFEILTPVPSGTLDNCYLSDPYRVDNVTIYYAKRDFTQGSFTKYDKQIPSPDLQILLDDATAAACLSPTDDNLAVVSRLQSQVDASATTTSFYYHSALPVATFGTADFPAWLSTDADNAILTHNTEDEDENTIYGNFSLTWVPLGMREGDYFICWTWTPTISGQTITRHLHFSLSGATQLTTSIPTHYTQADKYETLLERYTAETFKVKLCESDLSPKVVAEFNVALAKTFTFIEDLANSLPDLTDANATHESILPLLGNMYNLRLKSQDPTRWRRQIKRAVPLYKKKGTLSGLEEAFDQAGMTLNSFTRYWQVISSSTWQEMFDAEEDGQTEFALSQTMIMPLDTDNFALYFRGVDEDDWTELDETYVTMSETTLTWTGSDLVEGDSIRVIYKIAEPADQSIEDYIRSLDLSDQRDERDQCNPPKNWNTRLIAEDDALFDVVISTRHPFADDVPFGMVRTEFAYSEKAYNMDAYNGSLRESTNPCDIDKSFIDPCRYCQSSKYSVDVEIQELDNDRITEAQEILDEFTPFHAQLHSISFAGSIQDFIKPPVETLTALVNIRINDNVISGNAQRIFSRVMDEPFRILRDELAAVDTPVSSASGTAYNVQIALFAPTIKLGELPIDDDSSENLLEVFAPSVNEGEYNITSKNGHHAIVTGTFIEPLDNTPFTFRISNIVMDGTANITQDDLFLFTDSEIDFATLGVKSDFDVTHNGYAAPWKVDCSYGIFEIHDVLPNGILVLNDPSLLLPTSTTTGISYTLKNDSDVTIATSTTGVLNVTRRALVEMLTPATDDVQNFVDLGNYLYYDAAEPQVPITEFIDEDSFYISPYSDGDKAGHAVLIYERIVESGTGEFHYDGMKLITGTNYETTLNIQNGENPPGTPVEDNAFRQNFLVVIDGDYFAISEIDGTTITLQGPHQDWTTDNDTGEAVTFDIIQFLKSAADLSNPAALDIAAQADPYVPGHDFSGTDGMLDYIDRRGVDVIAVDIDIGSSMAPLLNAAKNGFSDFVKVQENIGYTIEYKDGTKESHEIE